MLASTENSNSQTNQRSVGRLLLRRLLEQALCANHHTIVLARRVALRRARVTEALQQVGVVHHGARVLVWFAPSPPFLFLLCRRPQ